jgi:hypothetical protein
VFKPAIGRQHPRGLFGIAEVFAHQARTAHVQHADPALAQGAAICVTHFDLVSGQDRTAAHERPCASRVSGRHRHREVFVFQTLAVDRVQLQAAIQRREGKCQRRFRHAVAGDERSPIEAQRRKEFAELLHQVGTDHVAADAGDTPARQVEPFRHCTRCTRTHSS